MAVQGHPLETDQTVDVKSKVATVATEAANDGSATAGAGLPPILTVDELAGLLRVNRKTAYAAISAGEIPGARRIGGSIRVHRDTVLDWLAGEGRAPSSRSNPR
jgi:excisionase family DNA binding protein